MSSDVWDARDSLLSEPWPREEPALPATAGGGWSAETAFLVSASPSRARALMVPRRAQPGGRGGAAGQTAPRSIFFRVVVA